MTAAERSSRWARRFVFAGAVFLVCWQATVLLGGTRPTGVTLGLLGFVFHTIFGKAYSLVPTYFDRELATTRFMGVHLALSLSGTLLLAVDAEWGPAYAGTLGTTSWAAGVMVFLGTIFWTIRDNLTGTETATGGVNVDRQRVDRVANLFVPIALVYLAVGSYELLAIHAEVPPTAGLPGEASLPLVFDGYGPRAMHLLAAGTGALLVFAIGFRLLPRFLVASPPKPLVWVVLPAGAVAPLLLAVGLPDGRLFELGALLQSVAFAGFAVAFWVLYFRSDRRRVGFYGVLACTVAGLLGVALGLLFAFERVTADLILAHLRLNVLGFLGLAIVGASYQFYPPAVGTFRGAGDRTALVAIGFLFSGLLVEVAALVVDVGLGVIAGQTLGLVGASLHVYLLAGLFHERYG